MGFFNNVMGSKIQVTDLNGYIEYNKRLMDLWWYPSAAVAQQDVPSDNSIDIKVVKTNATKNQNYYKLRLTITTFGSTYVRDLYEHDTIIRMYQKMLNKERIFVSHRTDMRGKYIHISLNIYHGGYVDYATSITIIPKKKHHCLEETAKEKKDRYKEQKYRYQNSHKRC